MPTSRCDAHGEGEVRHARWARAPSAMLTTSTPPSMSIRAAAMARAGSRPTGGFTSTETTKRRADSGGEGALLLGGTGWAGAGAGGGSRGLDPGRSTQRRGARLGRASRRRRGAAAIRAAAAMRLTCSGVVPQQPPIRLDADPGSCRRAKTPKYSGVET